MADITLTRAELDDDLTLEGLEGLSLADIEEAGPQIERRWRKEWTTISEQTDVLMHGAAGNRVVIVCKDGHAQIIEFDRAAVDARREITMLKVPSEGESDGMQNVEVADVIELIWNHGGVDLAASRTATKRRES